MSSLLWSQVVEVSRDKARTDILAMLDSVGFTASSWQEGSPQLGCVEVGAFVWSEVSKIGVFLKSLALNETSVGEALTRLSKSHYANTRNVPISAQRRITLTCVATEGPHPIDVGDVVVSDDEEHTFRLVEGLGVVFPATIPSGGSITVLCEAEVAGDDHNVPAGTVTTLVTTFAGVTVTSDTIEREGVDEESDPRLRSRNSSKWALLTRFELIRDAIEAMALAADPSVAQVGIDDQNPRGAGTWDMYIAQATSTASSSVVAAVQTFVNRYVLGNNGRALVKAAPEAVLDLVGTVYYDGKFAEADVRDAVEEVALTAYLATIPLGGFDFSPGPAFVVPKNDVEAEIRAATINGVRPVKTVQLTTPAADLAVGSFGKVVRGSWSLTYVAINNG